MLPPLLVNGAQDPPTSLGGSGRESPEHRNHWTTFLAASEPHAPVPFHGGLCRIHLLEGISMKAASCLAGDFKGAPSVLDGEAVVERGSVHTQLLSDLPS